MRLPEESMKSTSNLIIDGTMEDEILLLGLMKIAELADPVSPCNMVIAFNPKPMRTHPKLPKRDPKSMHLLPKYVRGPNNKAIPQLHEVLCIEGYFLTITRKWISGDKLSLSFPVSLRTESINDDRPQFQSLQAIMFGPYLLAGMTDGEWDLSIGNMTSFSDWITSVPPDFASQLFTFGQEWKISGSNESKNNTLVFTYNNSSKTIIMDSYPEEGTNEAARATFRIVDSDLKPTHKKMRNSGSALDFVGKTVYLELFDQPGMVIAHQGFNNNLTVSQQGEVSLADKGQCSLRTCMQLSVDNATIFKVLPGLDGNNYSLSFESVNLPTCFLYGGTSYQTGQTVQLQCKPTKMDLDFNHAVSYNANTGLSAYHPISFIATGSKRSYLLAPLLAFRDESYTVYFHITT